VSSRDSNLSQASNQDFACLLERLAADAGSDTSLPDGDSHRDTGAAHYELLRHRLVRYFQWERCADPELCADEVFSRMAQKLAEGEEIVNPRAYLFGIARMLRRETLARQGKETLALEEFRKQQPDSAPSSPSVDAEQTQQCLERCLGALDAPQRAFILRYYEGGQSQRIANRKAMADELGLDLNALRNRALRLRERLEKCARKCLSEGAERP
jgi:DNA-directed RNA polymerase specialized sigma24 family protein